uniref:Putative secreted protein n=1 Tax=Ixodes ricinus TaxID=34613 RepID=A0A6B0UDS4_IXORI
MLLFLQLLSQLQLVIAQLDEDVLHLLQLSLELLVLAQGSAGCNLVALDCLQQAAALHMILLDPSQLPLQLFCPRLPLRHQEAQLLIVVRLRFAGAPQ